MTCWPKQAHARALIATINEQLDIVRKADSILSRKLSSLKKSDPEWQQYLADCQRWRRIFDDGLRVIQKQHRDKAINPVSTFEAGERQQKKRSSKPNASTPNAGKNGPPISLTK